MVEDGRPRIVRLLESAGRIAWQIVGVAVAVWIMGLVFSRVREVLVAVFVALVLVALVEPLAMRMERRGLGRRTAGAVGLGVIVLTLAGSITVVGMRLVADLPEVVADLRSQRQPLLELLERPPLSLTEEEVGQLLDRGIEEASGEQGDTADEVVSSEPAGDDEGPAPGVTIALIRGAASATKLVGAGLIGVVLAFFLLRDRDAIANGAVRHLAGGPYDDRARAALGRGWRALIGYVRGSVLIGLIDAGLIGAALFILGVPLAGVLTGVTFLAAFIPVVGATLTGLLAVVIAFVSVGTGPALGLLVWIVVVQQLDGHLLQPMVMQGQANLHPVVTILALTVGGLVGGILGALLAVPLAAVVTNMAASLSESAAADVATE